MISTPKGRCLRVRVQVHSVFDVLETALRMAPCQRIILILIIFVNRRFHYGAVRVNYYGRGELTGVKPILVYFLTHSHYKPGGRNTLALLCDYEM